MLFTSQELDPPLLAQHISKADMVLSSLKLHFSPSTLPDALEQQVPRSDGSTEQVHMLVCFSKCLGAESAGNAMTAFDNE